MLTKIAQPRFETQRLVLQSYKISDLSDIFEYASNPEVARFVPWQTHQTPADSQNFIEYVQQNTSDVVGELFFVFALRLKETGHVIGSIDFKNTDPFCGQIDYALGFEHWNQGYVTEAALAVKDWAFATLPEMNRLQAFCVAENLGSARVMEKIGMQREGVRRRALVLKGQPVDLVDYSLIREDLL